MVQLLTVNGAYRVAAQNYNLILPTDRPFVYLNSASGSRLAELFVYSSVHPLHARDDSCSIGCWQAIERADEVILSTTVTSSVWKRKTYTFRCLPNRLLYQIEIEGRGSLCEANYFGGYYSGQVRWGSGFFYSGHEFLQGFTPEPNGQEQPNFHPSAGAAIDLMGVPLPARSDWFFTPPPFFFAFQAKTGWVGMGVETDPGLHTYTRYAYRGQANGFHLALDYEGHTQVNGAYTLPAIAIDFANDPYAALASHTSSLLALNAPEPQPSNSLINSPPGGTSPSSAVGASNAMMPLSKISKPLLAPGSPLRRCPRHPCQ